MRTHFGRWLLWVSLGANVVALDQSVSEIGPKEAFKQLLSAPPPVAQLVFREKLPPVANEPVPLQGGIEGSTNFALYQLRWQSNGLVVHSLRSTNQTSAAQRADVGFTLWNDTFCFLDIGTNAFVYQLEHQRAQQGQVTPSYDAAWYRVSRYGEVLNLGLSHLWPGTVHWDGDRFTARGIADKKAIYLTGVLSSSSNGLPCELKVAYSNDMNVAHYRIAYEYTPEIQLPFPGRIRLFFQNRGSEIEFRSYELLSLTRAQTPMPRESFAPEALTQTAPKSGPMRYLTNGSIYIRLPSGQMLETPAASAKLSLGREDYHRNRYFYAATALVGASFVFLIVRTNGSKHNQKNHANP
jgi:hypothetical protein